MDNIALEFKDVTGKGFGFKLKNVSMTLENGYISKRVRKLHLSAKTEQEKRHCLTTF